jgi:hypothetical protein
LADNASSTATIAGTTATPEPASIILLGVGTVSLIGNRWRRRCA